MLFNNKGQVVNDQFVVELRDKLFEDNDGLFRDCDMPIGTDDGYKNILWNIYGKWCKGEIGKAQAQNQAVALKEQMEKKGIELLKYVNHDDLWLVDLGIMPQIEYSKEKKEEMKKFLHQLRGNKNNNSNICKRIKMLGI